MDLLLGLALAALLFYYLMKKHFNYWKKQGVKQEKSLWILGDTWRNSFRLESPVDLIQRIYNYCPSTRYFGIYQFFTPTLVLRDPDIIKTVTVKDFNHFENHRDIVPENIDPLWGKNLLVLQGKKWHDTRTLLSPSFTSSKLKTMFSFIKQYAEDVAQHLVENDQDICVLEMKHLFSRVTNDLIATTSFGVNVDSIAEPDNTFYVMGKKVTDFTTLRVNLAVIGQLISPYFFKIFKLSLFANEVRSYFNDLINDIVKSREKNAIVRPDMIHLMLQAKSQNHAQENGHMDLAKGKSIEITNEDIAAQAMIFFFGGLDSTSSLMCFTAYELAVNRDIQGRLRREIRDTWEECQGSLTFDALSKMTYMDMVVSEVLRKWPNFLFTDRVCSKDYTIQAHGPEENSVYLKKGASILLPIYGIHHDPKHYPDPERFDPERFNDENKRKRHPYAYLPFGVGPRMCIGARFATIETKAIFFYILLHFEIVPVEETVIPVVASKKHFNLQPNDGLKLGLVRVSE